jgi:secondary thiamine-phosphate synthase enzyme
MKIVTESISLNTEGRCHMVDLTSAVAEKLSQLGLVEGLVTVFVPGSTGAVTTIEFEPGLAQDVPELLDRLIPQGAYHHDKTWGDGNGHAHLRASIIGPSLQVPFSEGKLALGTWQQIVFIDFDTQPRRRRLVLQYMGN